MLNLVLFGPPGAGKGTQSQKLVEKYNLVHLSTGDIFRFNIKNATELGTLAKSYMDKGELVPDEVTINMLKAEVVKIALLPVLYSMDSPEPFLRPKPWILCYLA